MSGGIFAGNHSAYPGSFVLPCEFSDWFSISVRNGVRVLMGIVLGL